MDIYFEITTQSIFRKMFIIRTALEFFRKVLSKLKKLLGFAMKRYMYNVKCFKKDFRKKNYKHIYVNCLRTLLLCRPSTYATG